MPSVFIFLSVNYLFSQKEFCNFQSLSLYRSDYEVGITMEVINIDQAKTQLLQLLVRVQQGEKIVIANGGKPVALLSQYQESQLSNRLPEGLRGQFTFQPTRQ